MRIVNESTPHLGLDISRAKETIFPGIELRLAKKGIGEYGARKSKVFKSYKVINVYPNIVLTECQGKSECFTWSDLAKALSNGGIIGDNDEL